MPRDPSHPSALADLAMLPFAEQLARLDESLAREDTPVPELLHAAASLRDHEPLAILVRTLAGRDALARDDVAAALGSVLAALPDTGVQRVLRGLDGVVLPAASRAAWVATVGDVLARLPVERVATTCLLVRWLRRADPPAAHSLTTDAVAACRSAIEHAHETDLDALRDLSLEGALEVAGLKGTVSVRLRQDGRQRTDYDLKVIKGVDTLDGSDAWALNASG
ncbi:MAG: hypothetical protein WCJ30_19915, partial [Deltaproteobacteria bacterium]